MNVRHLCAALSLTAALLATGCSCGSHCRRPAPAVVGAAPIAPCPNCGPSGVPAPVPVPGPAAPAPVPAFSPPPPVNGSAHP